MGLAQWLTQPDHPLTARVVVNRFWQQLFGQGLVKTSDNFGMQGEWPSHPELLDWLAREFIDSGWNVKALMKRIVLSATYRQDSAASPELIARDPENRLLARGPRFRLPAEILRDQALAVSGLLKNRLGGPSVYPYQPDDLYKGIVVAADYPGTRYVVSNGDDLYRRSLYTFWKRTVPHPVDDGIRCAGSRVLRGAAVHHQHAATGPDAAERSDFRGGGAETGRAVDSRGRSDGRCASGFAFRLATGRAPDAEEQRLLTGRLDAMLAALPGGRAGGAGAGWRGGFGMGPFDPAARAGGLHRGGKHDPESGRSDYEGVSGNGLLPLLTSDLPAGVAREGRIRSWRGGARHSARKLGVRRRTKVSQFRAARQDGSSSSFRRAARRISICWTTSRR